MSLHVRSHTWIRHASIKMHLFGFRERVQNSASKRALSTTRQGWPFHVKISPLMRVCVKMEIILSVFSGKKWHSRIDVLTKLVLYKLPLCDVTHISLLFIREQNCMASRRKYATKKTTYAYFWVKDKPQSYYLKKSFLKSIRRGKKYSNRKVYVPSLRSASVLTLGPSRERFPEIP